MISNSHASGQENSRALDAPYWSYGDLGLFLSALAVLTLGLPVLTRLHLLSKSQLYHRSDGLQIKYLPRLSGPRTGAKGHRPRWSEARHSAD